MIDGTPYKDELSRRLAVIRRLLSVAHPIPPPPALDDVGRETRGVCVVLLFAAYENLLTTLCRGLLEAAARLGVSNRRLKPGLKLFAVYGDFQAIQGSSTGRLWSHFGPRVFDRLERPRPCSINVDLFPADGSFMKRTQVSLFCRLFELSDPAPILKEVWGSLDSIVAQRNAVAHGAQTPEEIGRNYSRTDIDQLVNVWETRWKEFIDSVAGQAGTRDFYRTRR